MFVKRYHTGYYLCIYLKDVTVCCFNVLMMLKNHTLFSPIENNKDSDCLFSMFQVSFKKNEGDVIFNHVLKRTQVIHKQRTINRV